MAKEEKNVEGEEVKAETSDEAQQTKAEATSQASQRPRKSPESPAEKTAEDKPGGPKQEEKPAEPDWKDQYARLLADFDNFKKRTARDREDTYRFAEADILGDILPTVDNLALALANAKTNGDDGKPSPSRLESLVSFVAGVQLVYDTLLKALKAHGAEPFDCVGKPLDTEKMEAIATLPNAEVEEGRVSIESRRGWMLKDKVLRAAQVVVSSGKPEGEGTKT